MTREEAEHKLAINNIILGIKESDFNRGASIFVTHRSSFWIAAHRERIDETAREIEAIYEQYPELRP